MQVFIYSEAHQNLSKLFVLAQTEEVEIRRKDGSVFSLISKEKSSKSPFDVPTKATTPNKLNAVKESRKG